MAKNTTCYTCSQCGAESSKWTGQCPDCGEWNTLSEAGPAAGQRARVGGYAGVPAEVRSLADVCLDDAPRLTTGMAELDRVLGGGLVPGSVVLIGGDPGVGKSTCLLQVCCALSATLRVLYVTGEESLQQITLRAHRLGLPKRPVQLVTETQVENIIATAEREHAQVLVIDSVQTMQMADIASAPGSVSQVRESAAMLTRFAKRTGTAIFLVGHVTKSGDLAGPRVLEHIIDVVCYFENTDNRFRILRAVKNRFGAANEIGVFAMTETGLKEIANPSAIFLSRSGDALPGSVVMVHWEGTRPLLVEIQALVDVSHAEIPRRVAIGLEQNRLAMLLAVLNRHGGIATHAHDVFVNVAGGVKVMGTSGDLAVALAIVSSLQNRPMPRDLAVFGEIGLAGEIRPVANGQERLAEAAKHGFRQAMLPKSNLIGAKPAKLEALGVEHIGQALAYLQKAAPCSP